MGAARFRWAARVVSNLGEMVKASQNRLRGAFRDIGSRAGRDFAVGLVAAAAAVLMFGASPAEAARHIHHHNRPGAVGFAPAPVSASIVLDADTGRVLSEDNADAITYPASLTKLMTLYLTFEDLDSGRLRLDQYLPISAEAASRPPTKLGLRAGDEVSVQDLILGVVTRSANDAAVVLAEGQAGGNEAAFADRMTRKARELGMTETVFCNASGLPDPEQHTSARDMAQLALALYHDFPREYGYFATRAFDFRGRIIVGHDHLLDWYPGADGLKTGYIHASGFNLVTSAVRDGHRLIGVVLGGPSAGIRDREMAALLDQGFEQIGVPIAMAERHTAPVLRPAVTLATASPAETRDMKPGGLPGAASRLVARLAPVGKAEAAEPPRIGRAAASADRWSIQLGAFHAETTAQKTARTAATLSVVKGKPSQIVESGHTAKARFYKARVVDLTPRQAQIACIALHKMSMQCLIIPPPLRVADR
jgi:D-alanyl-D-alanine carboxypeptidase